MSDKPENFVIISKRDTKIVERHFDLGSGEYISYRISIPEITGKPDPSIMDLHNVSADLVITKLLQLLPADYGKNREFRPGPK